jgi:hypothetical protein
MGEREIRLATRVLKESFVEEKDHQNEKLKVKDCRASSLFTHASRIITHASNLQYDSDSMSYFYQTGFVSVGSNGTKIGLRGYVVNNERPDRHQLRSCIYVLTQEGEKEPEKLIKINKLQPGINLDREFKTPAEYKKLKNLLNLFSRKIGFNAQSTK